MKNVIQSSLFILALTLTSCGQNTESASINEEESAVIETEHTLNPEESESMLKLGDSISNIAQSTLMKNVSMAMKEGGPVHAVEFCNLRAMPLTDSISTMHNVTIQRVTDKTRNPNNGLETETDKLAWENATLANHDSPSTNPIHFLEKENDAFVYYKPISIGMPTCLKCHGAPEKDIDKLTAMMLNEKYPEDQAINYQLNDLRGMWKISFEEKK